MPPISQDHRVVRLTTPLDTDKLVFRSLNAFERLSMPFECRIVASAEEVDWKADDLLGKACSVVLDGEDGPLRHFHGLCAQVSQIGTDRTAVLFQLILRPEFWFLSRNRDYRIFQDMSVPDIISQVLQDRGLSKFDANLANYPKRVYCVQYGESDYAFLCRLMEEEGIHYFFRHDANSHRLVITDSKSEHTPAPGCDSVRYLPPGAGVADRDRQALDEWSPQHSVGVAAVKSTDFNFEQPKPIEEKKNSEALHSRDDAQVFAHPGGYMDKDDAKRYADIRLEAERTHRVLITASGNALGMAAGAKFTLTDHFIPRENTAYLVIETRHHIALDAYHSGASSASAGRVDLVCIPEETNFRPPLVTPKPRIIGAQTAIVTGKEGEEIETDKFGRIRVHFHWDTYPPKDNKPDLTSCWVRVAQFWAGKQWGAVFIPRIGHEVLVEFIDGNPDRPLVTGSVYNGDNMVPYSLPGEKTKSTIKSDSSKGGGGYNELRFEDKQGSEEVYLQAQKDMNVLVKHDLDTQVGNNETRSVAVNRTTKIGSNDTLQIGANLQETVGASQTTTVGMNRSSTITMNESLTVALQRTETIGINDSLTIGAMRTTMVGAADSLTVGGVRTETIGGAYSLTVGGAMSLTSGGPMMFQAGGPIMITSASAIVINASGAVMINSAGATMSIANGHLSRPAWIPLP